MKIMAQVFGWLFILTALGFCVWMVVTLLSIKGPADYPGAVTYNTHGLSVVIDAYGHKNQIDISQGNGEITITKNQLRVIQRLANK